MADPRHPRRFTEEFKRQIVQLYENGRPAMEIETECDISHSTLHRWVRGRNGGSTRAVGNHAPGRNELIALRRRDRQLEMEVDVLNKRRRYSHESRRDAVRRRPLPDIVAVRDPGRCQVDLLLDARPPRDRMGRPPWGGCGARVARRRQVRRGFLPQRRQEWSDSSTS